MTKTSKEVLSNYRSYELLGVVVKRHQLLLLWVWAFAAPVYIIVTKLG